MRRNCQRKQLHNSLAAASGLPRSAYSMRLGVKTTTCKAKDLTAKAKDLTFKAKAKDLILEDNKVGYQNEYKSATMSKFNC